MGLRSVLRGHARTAPRPEGVMGARETRSVAGHLGVIAAGVFLGWLQGGAGVKKEPVCGRLLPSQARIPFLEGGFGTPEALPPRAFPPSCPLHPPGLSAQESEF